MYSNLIPDTMNVLYKHTAIIALFNTPGHLDS